MPEGVPVTATFPHSSDLIPLALTGDFEDYRDAAMSWMDSRCGEWSCDDLARDVPAPNSAWPGEVIQAARRRKHITWTGAVRASTRPSRRGSLVRVFITTARTD